MKTFVYVDAFNLYYGCIKGTPYKWLDINALCRISLPRHSIDRIKYFTNLASHLLRDAHLGLFECAVIVSGDSDLRTPVVMVRNELRLPVGVVNPQQRRPCRALKDTATFYKHIRSAALQAAQFPVVLTDSLGRFNKPASW